MLRIAITALLGLGVLATLACAPKPATPSLPSPQTPLTSPTTAAPAPTVSAEEKAWNEVIAAAKKEGKLTAYSMVLIGDIGPKVTQAFAEKYGIKVDVISGMGANLAERILTEKRMGQMVADLMDANTFQISAVKDKGGTISLADIAVLRERNVWKAEPWVADPDKHLLVRSFGYLTTFVNTNAVKPQDEPKSFKELTQPKWKGKLLIVDPLLNSTASNGFATLLRRKLIDLETLRGLGKNGIIGIPNSSEAVRLLIQGSYVVDALTIQGAFTTYVGAGATGLPVKPVVMEEGTVAQNRAMGVIKDGPHPNAAKLFINWILSREGQDTYVKAEGMNPVRNDVPDFTPPFLQMKPSRLVALTLEDEQENIKLFRDKWLTNLWKE